jgi:hypothetical protein
VTSSMAVAVVMVRQRWCEMFVLSQGSSQIER